MKDELVDSLLVDGLKIFAAVVLSADDDNADCLFQVLEEAFDYGEVVAVVEDEVLDTELEEGEYELDEARCLRGLLTEVVAEEKGVKLQLKELVVLEVEELVDRLLHHLEVFEIAGESGEVGEDVREDI